MAETNFEDDVASRRYARPYGRSHPIPTVQGYREHQKKLEDSHEATEEAQKGPEDQSRNRRAYDAVKSIFKGEDVQESNHHPYPATNHNDASRAYQKDIPDNQVGGVDRKNQNSDVRDSKDISATEQASQQVDVKDKRKAMKKNERSGAGREVTDPVTHLPIWIHDSTNKDLSSAPENKRAPGMKSKTATGLSGASKEYTELDAEQIESQRSYNGLQKTFPPPDFTDMQQNLAAVYALGLTVGLAAVLSLAALTVLVLRLSASWLWTVIVMILSIALGSILIFGINGWLKSKVREVWEDETWDALRHREAEDRDDEAELPESTQWLNSTLTSVWPLVNPDLFSSLVDMLEDVMQASLPKVIRMVAIEDMGQGTESIRIMGIKWLPTGAASQSVAKSGKLESPEDEKKKNDRIAPGQGEVDKSADPGEQDQDQGTNRSAKKKQEEQEELAMRQGMEAEEGEFVNMELAFAYRARKSGKSVITKAKNAHLYLKFYLPGGIAIPVWVELRGLVGIMRVRLQLTPDPPFFSLCTLTFLGQPRVDMSCIPLSKHNLNIMDLPLVSSFVQSSVDAALAEYVAPKSLTLNLKEMLVGEDFKKDTVTRGVVWIYIHKARDFKEGDGGFGPISGASDSYVTVSWGKFGKPVTSTRIIVDDQEPNWHEWASILVTADELNANEVLRLQLWDSDKHTADDDLGRVEISLHDLMHDEKTKNKMCDREDRLKGEDSSEDMPGFLSFSVGYFAKTRITEEQLKTQTYNKHIRTKQEMKTTVARRAAQKLREAYGEKGMEEELHQQRVEDYKEEEDNMLMTTPPSSHHKSGILSIQIHNVTGLEVSKTQYEDRGDEAPDTEDDSSLDHLPDSYCTIVMNHNKIYRTRTKPKNGKPFFNAGTERFVKDWTTTDIIISCRDAREREDDALLGVVYLPLWKVFENRSQIMENFPLAGGIGYGKVRVSMVWRSVELQLPKELMGWDYGTLEIKGGVFAKGGLPDELQQHRLKTKTTLTKARMYPHNGNWLPRNKNDEKSVFLAVRRRYATPFIVEFRKSSIGLDKTPAFAVLWLYEIEDEEWVTKTIPVYKGNKENIKKGTSCAQFEGYEKQAHKLGEIEITMKFWRGLSGYHKKHAQQDETGRMRDVMECLDTINDEELDKYSDDSDEDSDSSTETESGTHTRDQFKPRHEDGGDGMDEETRKKLKVHTNDDDTGSDSESVQSTGGFAKVTAPITAMKEGVSKAIDKITDGQDNTEDGKRGALAQIADYKAHRKQLHRKHRGIMQWKSARTLDWAGGKVKRSKNRLSGLFHHSEKDQGVETEV